MRKRSIDQFVMWLEVEHSDVLPLTLKTGTWAGKVLKYGWCQSDTKYVRAKSQSALEPLLMEYLGEHRLGSC